LPARAEIAANRFRAAQLGAAEETLRVAADTRQNYYRAVAAQELVGFLTQAHAAAEAFAARPLRILMMENMPPISAGPNLPSPLIIGSVFAGAGAI
jgi:hypothetical protein